MRPRLEPTNPAWEGLIVQVHIHGASSTFLTMYVILPVFKISIFTYSWTLLNLRMKPHPVSLCIQRLEPTNLAGKVGTPGTHLLG